jgi:hypothetical protein
MRRLLFPALTLLILAGGAAAWYVYNKKFGDHRKVLDYPEGLTQTEGMLAVLDVKRKDFQDPANFYANSAKFQRLNSQEVPTGMEKRMPWEYRRSVQALNMDDTEQAISIAENAIAELDAQGYDGKLLWPLVEQLGISYFRLGEVQNCLNNHNSESCIIPFTDNAVHRNQKGSRNAIKQYLRLLEHDPQHHHARYMLNLSYVTLGLFPDSVPEAYRIPEENMLAGDGIPRFRNVAEDLGVNCYSTSGSAIIEDFNGDGHLDIFASGFLLTEQARLFFADGEGGYQEVTEAAGLSGLPGGLNTTHADYDNDGDRDIFILRGGWWNAFGDVPNSLLRNNGNGTFTDVTREAGLLSLYPTQNASWADYNGDGWLDIFIGNESSKRSRNNPCELYINQQDGSFKNMAKGSGLDVIGYIKGSTAGDYDGDGDPDIFVSVYNGPNVLYRNRWAEDGELRFEDVTETAGVAKPKDCFPAWWFDYDHDGRLDLCVLTFSINMDQDIAAEFAGEAFNWETSKIYWNKGDGSFEDRTAELGMETMLMSMGSNYGDLDNDGWLDFYVGTGKPDLRALYPNRMFLSQGGKRFEDVTLEGGFGHLQKGHAIVFADMDNDGDQDIYAQMGGAMETDFFQNALFENPGFGGSWLTLRVEGSTSNRDAIGARIALKVLDSLGDVSMHYYTVSTGGSFGGGSFQQEIGLGAGDSILECSVQWPLPGAEESFGAMSVNNAYRLKEGTGTPVLENSPAFRFRVGEGNTPHQHGGHEHAGHGQHGQMHESTHEHHALP